MVLEVFAGLDGSNISPQAIEVFAESLSFPGIIFPDPSVFRHSSIHLAASNPKEWMAREELFCFQML